MPHEPGKSQKKATIDKRGPQSTPKDPDVSKNPKNKKKKKKRKKKTDEEQDSPADL